MGKFEGFDPEAFNLLVQIRLHNSKEYYEEMKPEYRRLLLEPFRLLIEDISPALLAIDPEFLVHPRVGKTISRMRRDTRFTRDKSFYRDTMWFYIRPQSYAWLDGTGFYFEMNPVGFHYGCGLFRTEPQKMELYRQMIADNTRRFSRIKNKIENAHHFELAGDVYKRDMGEGILPRRLYDWYNRKAVYLRHSSGDMASLQSPAFSEELSNRFTELKDIYRFFREICDNYRQQKGPQ